MKPFRLNLDSSELLVGDFNSGFVFFSTQFRFDTQAASGGCAADKVDNHLMANKRSTTPILCDEGKQTMFNLIPLMGNLIFKSKNSCPKNQ